MAARSNPSGPAELAGGHVLEDAGDAAALEILDDDLQDALDRRRVGLDDDAGLTEHYSWLTASLIMDAMESALRRGSRLDPPDEELDVAFLPPRRAADEAGEPESKLSGPPTTRARTLAWTTLVPTTPFLPTSFSVQASNCGLIRDTQEPRAGDLQRGRAGS